VRTITTGGDVNTQTGFARPSAPIRQLTRDQESASLSTRAPGVG
jgi:hypothetical protein